MPINPADLHAVTTPDSSIWHPLSFIGGIWTASNLATYGATLITLVPPLLLGIGSVGAFVNSRQKNRIDRDRLIFDRQRYEDDQRSRLATQAVVASAAATSPAVP